jgi:hypothetical protein
LSRMPPMCNALYPAVHKVGKMTHHGQSGSKQLLDCVRWEKSVFFGLFFIIHISQKKHCNYVIKSIYKMLLSWPDNQMHGSHHQESNTDSSPSQQCIQNSFIIKGTWKPHIHTLKEQNKASSKDKSWLEDSVLLCMMMCH